MSGLMSIGEFSDRSGLSQKRLRSYAAVGILLPAAVDSTTGYRFYGATQLREAELIDALRQAGMPLADIDRVLHRASVEQLDRWERQLAHRAVQRHRALQRARRLLSTEASTPVPHDDHRTGEVPMTTFASASRTETGRVRESNEDAVLSGDRMVAVADGIGGAPGGEVASATAVALLQAAFTGRSLDELAAVVRAANWAIFDRATRNPEFAGMGTTICVGGLVGDGQLGVVNVGDSRVYLLRDGSLRLMTRDHSVTAELVRRGELSEAEARVHPHRRVLTRALGVGPDVEVDSSTHEVLEGDRLLLCSDGLFTEVSDEEISTSMLSGQGAEATADQLVELALAGGGHDNITVVVADIVA